MQREADRERRKPVVEVVAKAALRDLVRAGAADALELALFEDAQQLGLHLGGELADVVDGPD